MQKIRETDTCGDLRSPVDVWIDPEGYYRVMVHEAPRHVPNVDRKPYLPLCGDESRGSLLVWLQRWDTNCEKCRELLPAYEEEE
jgi:hypothetical protein